MKPYGQKQEKTVKGIHNSDNCGCEICNTGAWKVLKSRERKHYYIEDEEPVSFDDIEAMIVIEPFGDIFKAIYTPLNIEVVGMTPDHAIHKAYEDFIIKTEIL